MYVHLWLNCTHLCVPVFICCLLLSPHMQNLISLSAVCVHVLCICVHFCSQCPHMQCDCVPNSHLYLCGSVNHMCVCGINHKMCATLMALSVMCLYAFLYGVSSGVLNLIWYPTFGGVVFFWANAVTHWEVDMFIVIGTMSQVDA